MALSTVTLTWNLTDFRQTGIPDFCTLWVTPTSILAATTDNKVIPAIPRTVAFTGGTGSLSGIVATDNANLVPAGWAYSIQVTDIRGQAIVGPFLTSIDFADGATQDLADLYANQVASAATYFQYVTMPQLQAEFDALISPTLGTCQSVLLYGADRTGATASDAAFAAALTACIGTGNPTAGHRIAHGYIYLPAGNYRLTQDWVIQAVIGLQVIGDGRFTTTITAHGTGFTNALIDADGIYNCHFSGFNMTGDGTEGVASTSVPLPWAFRVTKNTTTFTNTTQNCFSQINILAFNWQGGFLQGAPTGTTNQVDGNTVREVLVVGGGSATFSFTTKWLIGFQTGNGIHGNQYNFVFTNSNAAQVQTGAWCNASGWEWYGGEPAGNAVDFLLCPDAQISIAGIQSQDSGRFIAQTAGGLNSYPISVRDCEFITAHINADGKWVKVDAEARAYEFSSVSCYSYTAPSPVPVMYFNGSGNAEVVTLINVSQNSTFAAGVTLISGTSGLVVLNYMEVNTSTGGITAITNKVKGLNAPQVTWVTATGVTSYAVPAGSTTIDVRLLGGGGGGGSGARAASGQAGGGAGGNAGGYSFASFVAADLGSSVTLAVGAGGAGGAAITGASSGNAGTAGGITAFGSFISAPGGGAGGAGTAAAGGSASLATGTGNLWGTLGGPGNATTTGGAGASGTTPFGATGGGGGAGTTGAAAANGGATQFTVFGSGVSSNGGVGGVAGGASPTAGTQPTAKGTPSCGGGGGASAFGASTSAQAGADAFYGGGGGGGGGNSAGTTSGKGGKGGDGFALIIAKFS